MRIMDSMCRTVMGMLPVAWRGEPRQGATRQPGRHAVARAGEAAMLVQPKARLTTLQRGGRLSQVRPHFHSLPKHASSRPLPPPARGICSAHTWGQLFVSVRYLGPRGAVSMGGQSASVKPALSLCKGPRQ